LSLLACISSLSHAQEAGQVISSTPIYQQVITPKTVCTQQTVAVDQPSSGAGAALGALAGAAIGSQLGNGGGRAAATAIGFLGGAVLGNQNESPRQQLQNQQVCQTQQVAENRLLGYQVVYEFAGKRYQTQLAQDPGPTLALNITPQAATPQASPPVQSTPNTMVIAAPTVASAPQVAPIIVYQQPVVTYSPPPTVVYQPAPVYYQRPWPIQTSIGINFGQHRRYGHVRWH
jgi:uncharacterized protein YcfJ